MFPGHLPERGVAPAGASPGWPHCSALRAGPARAVADRVGGAVSGEAGGLEEGLASDPVGVAGEDDRAVPQVGEEQGRDGVVVGDEVALGVAVGRPEDLVEVREPDPAGPRAWSMRSRPLRTVRRSRRPSWASRG